MLKLSKGWKWGLAVAGSVVLMVAVIPAAIWITHTSSAELGNSRVRCARGRHSVHKVIVKNGRVNPIHTQAQKCDTLIITNMDDQQRLLAFGRHDNHISYDGVSEKLLDQGQSLTVTLIKPGTYLFHDHENPIVAGTFTVEN